MPRCWPKFAPSSINSFQVAPTENEPDGMLFADGIHPVIAGEQHIHLLKHASLSEMVVLAVGMINN